MVLDVLNDEEILALTIIGEARGEPIEGQVAVGCVIRNRLHSQPDKYKSYRDVCLEPRQFSCWNTDDSNYQYLSDIADKWADGQPSIDPVLRQCELVATGIKDWSISDNTKGAKYYMTRELFYSNNRPKWAKTPKFDPLAKGNQIFFNV